MNTDESTWGPTTDPARGRGSGECVRFCPNNVYESEESTRQVRVARCHQCVVMCNNCASICPNQAITFPDQQTFPTAVGELHRRARGSSA